MAWAVVAADGGEIADGWFKSSYNTMEVSAPYNTTEGIDIETGCY